MQAERTADTNGRRDKRKEIRMVKWLPEEDNGKEFQK